MGNYKSDWVDRGFRGLSIVRIVVNITTATSAQVYDRKIFIFHLHHHHYTHFFESFYKRFLVFLVLLLCLCVCCVFILGDKRFALMRHFPVYVRAPSMFLSLSILLTVSTLSLFFSFTSMFQYEQVLKFVRIFVLVDTDYESLRVSALCGYTNREVQYLQYFHNKNTSKDKQACKKNTH